MILQALVKEYENLAEKELVTRPGWCHAKVSYGIDLTADGRVKGIIWLKSEEQRGKKKVWLPIPEMVPEMVTRSSGVSANFLCDNSKYLLGIDQDGTNDRVMECFLAAKKRHFTILKDVPGIMAKAICNFFENWDPRSAKEYPEIKEKWEDVTDGGNLIFCMGIDKAHEDRDIADAWMRQQSHSSEEDGICLVTGRRSEISRIHKTIKGVPGAQASGATLVSFNAPAFESYGKEQSYNAPVGKYAEYAYTTALNYLLAEKEYAFALGDSMVVFWAEEGKKEYQDVFSFLITPQISNQKMIHDIFEKLHSYKFINLNGVQLDKDQKFYILSLAPNAARLSVRFFYENSFGNILDNLSCHYERMKIVRPSWEDREYLGVWQMLYETVNQNSKDKKPVPNTAAMVLQAIISGSRYPASLYSDVLIRIRAEQGKVTWGRAAIIKAYLIKNYEWTEGTNYMGLNKESKDTAYVLGRLFSVLESIQMDANTGIKATIRDRYFNSACATPASVFPVLVKLKNSHIKKLERDKGSAKIYYEQLLTELMGKLESYPKRLSLEDQGKFILGYYHQTQKKYEKKEEK